MGIKWKKHEEYALYRKLVQERIPLDKVAILNRKFDGIRRKAIKMGLILRQRNPALTEAQKEKLRQLAEQGFSARQIAENGLLEQSLCRTANSIQKYLGKLGAVNKNRSEAAKSKKVWQDGEEERFISFLIKHSARFTAKQIAERFGVKRATVASRQRFLGIKRSFKQALAIPSVRARMKQVYREKAKKMLSAFESRIAAREEKLAELAEKIRLKRQNDPIEEKHCAKCASRWPIRKKFFYHTSFRISIGSSWRVSNICVICEAKRRHRKNAERYQKRYSRNSK